MIGKKAVIVKTGFVKEDREHSFKPGEECKIVDVRQKQVTSKLSGRTYARGRKYYYLKSLRDGLVEQVRRHHFKLLSSKVYLPGKFR